MNHGAHDLTEGRVIRGDARVYHVEFGGEVRQCVPRGKLFEGLQGRKSPLAVGDRVLVSATGDPPGIEQVLPRRNYLSRIASAHDPREQVLFANVDQLVVVSSIAKPAFSSNRADRILAAARWHGIPTTLLLNKADLDKQGEEPGIRATYEAAGVAVVTTRAAPVAPESPDLAGVIELLSGKVTALYGASGVGKSTLLNAIQPGLGIKVGKISKYWSAGKHTTSYSQMHPLAALGPNSWVIDTPGVRVFRLHGLTKEDVRTLFPEFAPYQDHCHFQNCTHDHEPDCAVFEAVDRGVVAPTRYASYVELLDEIEPPREEDVPMDPTLE